MGEGDENTFRVGQVKLSGNNPLEITEITDQPDSVLSDVQQDTVRHIAATVKAYVIAAKELLSGRYAHLRDLAPAHLADPGNVLALCCPDGVAIRFERKTDEERVFAAGWLPILVADAAPLLSQNVIHCYSDRNYTSTIPTTGAEIRLTKHDATSKEIQDIVAFRIGIDAVIEQPESLPSSPQKPFCLLSVRNAFEFGLVGELVSVGANLGEGERFLAQTTLRLPFGWECIEIFPFFDLAQWTPEYAPMWAEIDILAAVVSQQLHEATLNSLDPNAAARREFGKLFRSFKRLLDLGPREEVLQEFLRDHPELLCPAQTKVWPKLAIGARKTDFVFMEAAGDYLLVELEQSSHRLFLNDGHQSRQLTHACGQILDWKRYLEDNLSTAQHELGLVGISSNPKSLVVIGRSETLSAGDKRKLRSIENESPKLKIMTYDDVFDNAKAVVENIFGSLSDINSNTQIYYLNG